ncbi:MULTISPECIES: hypothetical protein [unclassified Kitasatospora]|uniref:hypothetical protein n=1 Tax=unclassified Kitasatospora TaxID=2633591 RepID=UPI0007089596|nr:MULTISPECIES: hypothetical protein [unclassified Kitasatospora]KQV23856.1 hypothetical protein ASC99_01140 [Kitasatospora sp. Root107]KRB67432.1 hypothetical protein ASE03_03595 [Kitasatospora sp. Root187]
MRGCLIVGLLPVAAFTLLLSMASTVEAESPEQFPGLRPNHGPIALLLLVVGVVAVAGALLAARGGSRWRVATAGAVCGLLLLLAGWRGVTLAPMLHCSGHTAISQEDDGSYRCADR